MDLIGLFLCFYFLPTIIVAFCNRRQTGAIAATNLLLGWTAIGWLFALIWAFVEDR